jgi:hypothetical protein
MLRATLVAVLFLAGCTDAPQVLPVDAEVVAVTGPPSRLDFRQAGCEAMTWSVPVLASGLQSHLPEGFEPAPATPAGVDQAATLVLQAVECVAGFGQDEVLRSVQWGSIAAPVLPPRDLRDDRYAHRFAWDVLVAFDAWRSAADALGLPVRDGGSLVGPGAQGWSGELAMDGAGSFAMRGRVVEAPRAVPDSGVRLITTGAQGFALWDAVRVNHTVATGLGTWTATPGSWVASVAGATQGVATFELETWDLTRADVHWPSSGLAPTDG